MLSWLLLITSVLATAPIKLFLRADLNKHPTFIVIAHVYGFRMQFDGEISAGGRISLRGAGGKGAFAAPLRVLFSYARRFISRVEWLALSVDACIGTGDACTTALATGAMLALLQAGLKRFGGRVRVKPSFEQVFFAAQVRCILFFRVGDIMLAGISALARYMGRGAMPMKRKEGNAHGKASH